MWKLVIKVKTGKKPVTVSPTHFFETRIDYKGRQMMKYEKNTAIQTFGYAIDRKAAETKMSIPDPTSNEVFVSRIA